MARKHPNPLNDPPAASSSGEEEEEVEEEEEEEEEDEEEVTNPNQAASGSDEEEEEEEEEDEDDDDKEELKTSQSTPLSKKTNAQEEEEEDDDDETESDSDPRSPGVSGFTIREHVSKPATESKSKPHKDNKESASPVLVSLKRPAESDLQKDSKSSKKVKTENGGGEEATTEKKPGVIRVWNEEGEVVILKGMIEFLEKRGVDPNSDSTAFHEYVKDRLSVEASKNQLMDKIRRLKKKYMNNVGKAQKGEDPVFSRPHEHKCFHLSKKIWGGDETKKKRSSAKKLALVTETPKPKTEIKDNGTARVAKPLPNDEPVVPLSNEKEQVNDQQENFSQLYPFLYLSLTKNSGSGDLTSKDGADAMVSCLRCLEKTQLEELEEMWRKQIIDEAAMCTRRSVILHKQVQMVVDWNAKKG